MMVGKTHKRAKHQNLDKHRLLEFRPVDVSQDAGGSLRETSVTVGRFWLQNLFARLTVLPN